MSEELLLPARPAKVVIRADLLPAVSVASLIALLGLAQGWIWSLIAPPERVGVGTGGQVLPLVDESYHRFDDIAIFLLIGLATGILTGAAAWLLRHRRGPIILLALVVGSLVAAFLARQIGLAFVAGLYEVPGNPAIGTMYSLAPRLESGWVLLAQPLGAVLAYGALASWHTEPDLGRRLD